MIKEADLVNLKDGEFDIVLCAARALESLAGNSTGCYYSRLVFVEPGAARFKSRSRPRAMFTWIAT